MRPSRGSRILLATLYALPVAELVVLIMLGRRIGALAVILLVLASTVVGVSVLRRAGSGAVRDLAAARARMAGEPATIDAQGRPIDPRWGPIDSSAPQRSPADRLLLALAGLLLVVPGLIGSALGLVLLLPGVRPLVRAGVRRIAGRRGWVDQPAQVRVISVEEITPERADPEG